MVRTSELLSVLEKMLAEKIGIKVYIDTIEEGYEKPSFFMSVTDDKTEDVNFSTVERTKKIRIDCYKDDSDEALSERELREKVCELFECRKIAVNDRKINISASVETNEDTGKTYVSLESKFFDERGIEKENYPIMETIETKFKEV